MEKRRVKTFWKLEIKNLAAIKTNLKIGNFGPEITIWLIDYTDERIKDEKLRFTGLER